jgi:hypothetical protein
LRDRDGHIRSAAASVTLVRAPSISLNLDESEALVLLSKASILAFTGEICQNNPLFYINERRIANTRKRTSDACFPCLNSLQFHQVQPSFLAYPQTSIPNNSHTAPF